MSCAGSEGYINHGLEMEDRERVPRSQSRQSRQQEVRRYKYFLPVHRYFLPQVSAKRLGHHSRAASALSVTGGGAGGRSSRQHRHTPAPGNGALSYR